MLETHIPTAQPHFPPHPHHTLCFNHSDLSVLGTLCCFLPVLKPARQLKIPPPVCITASLRHCLLCLVGFPPPPCPPLPCCVFPEALPGSWVTWHYWGPAPPWSHQQMLEGEALTPFCRIPEFPWLEIVPLWDGSSQTLEAGGRKPLPKPGSSATEGGTGQQRLGARGEFHSPRSGHLKFHCGPLSPFARGLEGEF